MLACSSTATERTRPTFTSIFPSPLATNGLTESVSRWLTSRRLAALSTYGISSGFWEPFSLAVCTRIQRLRLSWQHNYLVRVPNEGYSEAYEAVLASTPPTLRELEFDFTAPLSDELRLTAPHVAQRIVQAAARFPGLGKVTLSILRPLTVGECTAVMNEFLPRGIVDRGLVRVEQKDGLCKCFSRYALPYVMQCDFSHHVFQNLLTGSYTEWPSAIEPLTFSVFLL